MSSAQGRFVSVDPLMINMRVFTPQSWNRYAYCYNNPLLFIDPSGLQPPGFIAVELTDSNGLKSVEWIKEEELDSYKKNGWTQVVFDANGSFTYHASTADGGEGDFTLNQDGTGTWANVVGPSPAPLPTPPAFCPCDEDPSATRLFPTTVAITGGFSGLIVAGNNAVGFNRSFVLGVNARNRSFVSGSGGRNYGGNEEGILGGNASIGGGAGIYITNAGNFGMTRGRSQSAILNVSFVGLQLDIMKGPNDELIYGLSGTVNLGAGAGAALIPTRTIDAVEGDTLGEVLKRP
jgi:hypothetical protein